MKQKLLTKSLSIIMMMFVLTSTIFAQPASRPSKEKSCCKCQNTENKRLQNKHEFDQSPQPLKKHYGWEKGKHKGEFFQQRLDKLVKDGVITEQEKQEVEKSIDDLKKYRHKAWEDGKLTKEEHQNLIEKEKAVREKTRQILEKAREEMVEEWRDTKEREKLFNERIENMLKNKKITQKEADKLRKQHKELLELEEKIWSDGVMTKEEQKELFKERREFHRKIRKFLERHRL